MCKRHLPGVRRIIAIVTHSYLNNLPTLKCIWRLAAAVVFTDE